MMMFTNPCRAMAVQKQQAVVVAAAADALLHTCAQPHCLLRVNLLNIYVPDDKAASLCRWPQETGCSRTCLCPTAVRLRVRLTQVYYYYYGPGTIVCSDGRCMPRVPNSVLPAHVVHREFHWAS